jgi:hypothetical protein
VLMVRIVGQKVGTQAADLPYHPLPSLRCPLSAHRRI